MEFAAKRSSSHAGLIIREQEPVNLEAPFDQLDELITPTELFYIRSHFKAPHLDASEHKLTLRGAVQRPFSIDLNELKAMPAVMRTATLECAGNSRIFLVPQVKGAQWQNGAVSTAKWTGVPLPALLERAGVAPEACEIVFEAADHGTPKEEPVPPGELHYARSLGIAKAKDVLIAYAMNGEDLPTDHGFPLRAIVPGHYGMASVKWLTGLRVVTEPFRGYFQTSDYAYWDYDEDGNPLRRALGEMMLKSAITRPGVREVIAAGESYRVCGAAWSGETAVAAVELSTDDGQTWQTARLLGEAEPFVWRRWEFAWKAPADPGVYVLKSRATDEKGRQQPSEHDKRFGTYVVHHTFGIEVVVR